MSELFTPISLLSDLSALILGIVASVVFWYIMTYLFAPKLEFREFIKRKEIGEEQKYYFSFRNSGRRAIIDIEVFAQLRIKGLDPKNKNFVNIIRIPLTNEDEISDRIPIMKPQKKDTSGRFLRLRIEHIAEITSEDFSESIRKKSQEHHLDFEELLALTEHASVRLYVFAYDKFSGTKKLFVSEPYRKNHINNKYGRKQRKEKEGADLHSM